MQDLINVVISLLQSLTPVSVTFVIWKDRGLLVKVRSIVDLWLFIKHVSDVTKFVKLKVSHNSSSLS